MGKNRDRANALFDALEIDLAKESGKEKAKLTKKVRSQILAMATKRGVTLAKMLEEVRPALLEIARQTREIQFPTLH